MIVERQGIDNNKWLKLSAVLLWGGWEEREGEGETERQRQTQSLPDRPLSGPSHYFPVTRA